MSPSLRDAQVPAKRSALVLLTRPIAPLKLGDQPIDEVLEAIDEAVDVEVAAVARFLVDPAPQIIGDLEVDRETELLLVSHAQSPVSASASPLVDRSNRTRRPDHRHRKAWRRPLSPFAYLCP